VSTYVRWFGDLGLGDVGLVGGKCANLGELTKAGFRVPPGFALTTAAYERFSVVGGMPDDVLAELRAAYEALCGSEPDAAVAVRSSAVGEDSAEASYAGQQETYLWQCGSSNVARAVVRCWASLHSPEATAYRARLGEARQKPTMAVAVQRMVDARVAGVLFTLSPATGDRSVIAINASWGLGVGVVGGEVTPDEYWVDKVQLAIRRTTIADKAREYRPDVARGGTREVAVALELRTVPCLSEQEVLELARLGKLLERHYGQPQDIEWAIARDARTGFPEDVFLLQSRPETVWSPRPAAPLVQPAASAVDYVLRNLLK
jgi:pyruvate, water dikinase